MITVLHGYGKRWESIWMTKLFEHEHCFLPQLILPVLMGGEKTGMAHPSQVKDEILPHESSGEDSVTQTCPSFYNPQLSFLLTYLTISVETAEGEIQRRIPKKQDNPFLPVAWLHLRDAGVEVCAGSVVAQSLVGGRNHQLHRAGCRLPLGEDQEVRPRMVMRMTAALSLTT